MIQNFDFEDVLAGSAEAAWQAKDVLPVGAELDSGRRFLPGAPERTGRIALPSDGGKRLLSPIRGRDYPPIFGLVEDSSSPSRSATAGRDGIAAASPTFSR